MIPIWSREVLPDLSGTHTHNSLGHIDTNQAGVSFRDDHTLIVYSVDHVGGQLSSRESPGLSSQFQLHVSLLDAKTGRLEVTRQMGTRFQESSIHATSSGVLVRTGPIISLYSPDLENARELVLPSGPKNIFSTVISGTGNTIMVNRISQNPYVSSLDVFDANTLKVKQSWRESPPLYYNYSISDQTIAASSRDLRYVMISPFGSMKWKTVAGGSKSDCLLSTPTFVTDSTLVVQGCEGLSLLTSAGGPYPLGSLDVVRDGVRSDKTAVAQGGRFTALSFDKTEIERHVFKEARRRITAKYLEVFDLKLKKKVFTFIFDPLPRYVYDFALSPDGSKLAILNDRKVYVCTVSVQPNGYAEDIDPINGAKNGKLTTPKIQMPQ